MAISLYDGFQTAEFFAEAGRQLDRLERVYLYINQTVDDDARLPALRLVILAMTHWRASVANIINGKIALPHESWNISREDLDPRAAVYVQR